MIAHPVTTIVNVSILAIILTYISAMKVKCGYCTNIPETQYVTVLTTVILVEVLFVALFPNAARTFFMENPWAIFILVVINVANIIFLYRFIGQMNISQCRQCTSEWRRSFLYYYSAFILILYAINILLIIVGFVVLSSSYNPRTQIVAKSGLKKSRK
jgi:hypothetical protein